MIPIEILVGNETIIDMENQQFKVGTPQRVALEGKATLEILYNNVIPASVKQQLMDFSSAMGITPSIVSREGVYLPDNEDLYLAEIPKRYRINIRQV